MTPTIAQITSLRQRAKAAIAQYKRDHALLFDRRGFPRFPREEHDARVADLRTERNRELREIEERATEIFRHAEAERAGQFTPDTVLTPLEQSFGLSRQPLVEADVASLSEQELAERLEGVLRDGSKTDRFMYRMAAA